MFGFKRKRFQAKLTPIAAKNEYELGCALLEAFRGMTASQQFCFYCDAHGGFEMQHHQNCVVDKAARTLFRHAKYDGEKRRYLTFEENDRTPT